MPGRSAFFMGTLVWAVFSVWGSARVERYYREQFGETVIGDNDRWERTPAGDDVRRPMSSR